MAGLTKDQILKRAIAEAWKQGVLAYKLHESQDEIYNQLKDGSKTHKQFFLLCTRRFGKSFLLLVKAFEQALQEPNCRVLYLAPTAKAASEIAQDLAQKVLADCPEELKPEINHQTKEFRCKNGSIIRLKGVNSETADNLRGGEASLIILDECAQMDNLDYVVKSVCLPMTATTRGQIIYASTPPPSPGHESVTIFERLAKRKATVSYNLRQAPVIPEAEKLNMLIESGEDEAYAHQILYEGKHPKTTAARRELFCEFVTDASLAVIPEFTKDHQAKIVREYKRPPYFSAYVGLDPGSRDNTAGVFGYVDFSEARFIVEDTFLLGNPSTKQIAESIKTIEERLWPHNLEITRVSDIDLRLIRDLAQDPYYLKVIKAQKSDMLASVNYLRNLIQTERLIINPRCQDLIRQLQNAIWNKTATDMHREQSYDKHYDLVSALRYLVRAINWSRDPYPENYRHPGFPGGPVPYGFHAPRSTYARKKLNLYGDTPVGKKLYEASRKK